MVSSKTDSFVRYVAASVLNMDEVDNMIALAIGIWDIDTFGEVYSIKNQ